MEIVIDLGQETSVTKISSAYISNVGSWIFLPKHVEYSVSSDGTVFTSMATIKNTIEPEDQGSQRYESFSSFPAVSARYVKVFAAGQRICPPWHAGADGKAWLFCDEVIVE